MLPLLQWYPQLPQRITSATLLVGAIHPAAVADGALEPGLGPGLVEAPEPNGVMRKPANQLRLVGDGRPKMQ